ncbi:hypothetical protein [Rhodopirellula europaea]|uniref:hypothetical protein n=2 Tax=Rhodopirellula TaxID=265488 RepID=UPI0030EE67AD
MDNLAFAATQWIAMNAERRTYKSDVSDEQWQLIGPKLERLTPPGHLGQPRKADLPPFVVLNISVKKNAAFGEGGIAVPDF